MIIHAAAKFYSSGDIQNPVIITGSNHADVYERATRLGFDRDHAVEGFITETDHFLDRYEAMYEAQRCNQLSHAPQSRALCTKDLR